MNTRRVQFNSPENAKIGPRKSITLDFECGCSLSYWIGSNGTMIGGLACCDKHENQYCQIEELLPLTLVKIINGQ